MMFKIYDEIFISSFVIENYILLLYLSIIKLCNTFENAYKIYYKENE